MHPTTHLFFLLFFFSGPWAIIHTTSLQSVNNVHVILATRKHPNNHWQNYNFYSRTHYELMQYIIYQVEDLTMTKVIEIRTQFHENVLAKTVLNVGNFLWMAKRVTYVTFVSTSLWTSHCSKGKVQWVNLNIITINSVNVNVTNIVKQWHYPLTSNLEKRM